MSINKYQKQTNKNIQEKANLIWNIATHLVGLYKPYEYGRVILPFTILKRFDDTLKDTKDEVVKRYESLVNKGLSNEDVLKKAAKHLFYNTSKFDFESLANDPDNLEENFETYINGYSSNVLDILSNFKFLEEVKKLIRSNTLLIILQDFCSEKGDMSLDTITAQDMGYIFEELVRKFSESYDEQAGAHFTSRDVVYLMTELLIAPEKNSIIDEGCTKIAYDMTMGTSQMLACLEERLKEINENSILDCFGQELNMETYAIAKADMLVKGKSIDNMLYGDTLSDDKFKGYTFDYVISNPPFGIDWKKEEKTVSDEYFNEGYNGRFGPGLPQISDGQLLFMLNGIKKLKEETGRMAIIQSGSSLFSGDAGSGQSEIRKYIIENDLLETIIQLPVDLFYNTSLSTYIWIIVKGKEERRHNKIQLIDASKCFIKRRKNIGSKRVDLDDECIELILKAYNDFTSKEYEKISSKVFEKEYFGYTKVTIETALVDETNKPILKKEAFQKTIGKTDTENIPLQEDIEKYFKQNILPYNKFAYLDRTKDKIGYEIPFARIFYKFTEPKLANDIYRELKELENEEYILTKELFYDER